MRKITKEELMKFIRDNCYVPEFSGILVDWNWREGCGSQSSKTLNKKVMLMLQSDAILGDKE